MSTLRHGDIVRVEDEPGAVLWAVVSNDLRNAALPNVLAARIVPLVKSPGPTAVELTAEDTYGGQFVLADFISTINASKAAPAGRLSPATTAALSAALRAALP